MCDYVHPLESASSGRLPGIYALRERDNAYTDTLGAFQNQHTFTAGGEPGGIGASTEVRTFRAPGQRAVPDTRKIHRACCA